MSKITPPQSIPAEMYDEAHAIGIVANAGNIVSQRPPWHYPQLGSAAQKRVWKLFFNALHIFAMQPQEGGSVPPDIGPRSREWWYATDPGYDPIYVNYFMHETLLLLHQDITPDWAKFLFYDDAHVVSWTPDANKGGAQFMEVVLGKWGGVERYCRAFMKTPGGFNKTVHLFLQDVMVSGMAQRSLEIRSVNPDEWVEYGITWNYQPAWGEVITTIEPPFTPESWIHFDIGNAGSFRIRVVPETAPGEGQYFSLAIASHETELTEYLPYYTITD